MNSKIKSLFSQASLYSLGGLSIRLIGFFLLPLYLTYLTPADYGIVELSNTLTNILVIIFGFGMSSAVFREYYREDDENYKKSIIGTAFIFLLFINLILIILLLLSRNYLANILLGIKDQIYVFMLILANIFFLTLLNINYAVVRAKEKPLNFSLFNIVRTLIYAGVNIYLIAVLGRGYVGVREGILISTFFTFLISSPYLIRNMNLKFSLPILKRMMVFGIPIIFSGLSLWVLNLTDRYMLKYLLPETIAFSQIGIYSLAAKLSSVGKLVLVQPFAMSWGVAMFKHEKEANAKVFYAKTFKYFIIIAAIFYVFTVLFAENIIHLLSNNTAYFSANTAVPLLTGSAMFSGIFMILSVGLTLTYKNKYSSLATIIAAILNIILNLILIPKFFMLGAATASIISSFVMIVLQYYFAQKYYRIPYDLKIFFIILVLCTIVSITSSVFSMHLITKFLISIFVIYTIIHIGNIKLSKIIQMVKK